MATRTTVIIALLLAAVGGGCSSNDDSLGAGRTNSPSRNPGLAGRGGGLIPIAGGGPGGLAASGGSGSGGVKPAPNLDPDTCASAQVNAARITPTVYLVLDGSGSMNANFGGGGTRWTVLRDALIGPSGVVTQLESVVKFGTAIYSNNNPMSCPGMTETAPSLSNLQMIQSSYPAMEPGGGTPTGEALMKVVDSLPEFEQGPDSDSAGPPIIILATDGEPNGCAAGVACNWVDWAMCLGQLAGTLAAAPATYDSTLAAVRKAKEKGIPVWVISLADGLNAIPDLQRTANIGAGLAEDASPGAMIYSPQNPNELTGTLTKLIGDVVSCEVELAGTLAVDRACEGSVKINGTELPCNNEQGWKPVDETHITLQGDSCAKFKSDPTVVLDARFPCDVVTPQ